MYKVNIVEDHELPTDTDWAMVRTADLKRLFVKRSRCADPETMAVTMGEVWAARVAIEGDPYATTPVLPAAV